MDPRTSLAQIKRTWHPPTELERARPREVRLTYTGKTLAGIVMALLLGGFVAGITLYAKASWDQTERTQFLKSGVAAEAWIVRRWTSGRDPMRYWVEYVYRAEGQSYKGQLSMKHNSWLNLKEMAPLGVRYLPADPRSRLVLGWEPELLPSWLSLPVAGILFFIAWLTSRILAFQRRLLAEGRPASAVVTRIARSSEQEKKVAHYVFMTMSGKLTNGKSSPLRNPPAVGSALNVIYDPDQENHNSIYPLSLVEVKRN